MNLLSKLARSSLYALPPLLTLLLFWPGLGGPFLFDDFPALVDNIRLHSPDLSFAELWKAAFSFEPGGGSRPLAMLSFAINHALGGLNPWGYKLGGLLVHALNSVLVLMLLLRLLALAGVQERPRQIAALALTLLWALHPLQVSAVLYVVQRMETLSLTFVLLALLTYLHGRTRQIDGKPGWAWLLCCLPLLALGWYSKESAALFPAYTLALELALLRFAAATPATARNWRWLYGIGTALGVLVFAFVIVPHYGSLETHTARSFNTAERLLSQLRILPMYLGQIVWPMPSQMPFYYDDFVPSSGWFSPVSTLLGGLFLLGLLAAAWLARQRAPLFTLGILWFFAGHAMTSNVIALELVFEHRNYFALLGILLAAYDLARRIPLHGAGSFKPIVGGAIVVLVMFFGALRAATWGEPLLLATELANLNPHSPRAAHELGVLYYEMADNNPNSPFFGFAEQQFQRESALPNSPVLAEQALILIHAHEPKAELDGYWDRLLHKLRHQPITPETTSALFALLDARYKGTHIDDARLTDAFLALFERVRLPAYSYAQVADHVFVHLHDVALSDRLLELAVQEGRPYPGYVKRLIATLQEEGRNEQAEHVRNYEKTLDDGD